MLQCVAMVCTTFIMLPPIGANNGDEVDNRIGMEDIDECLRLYPSHAWNTGRGTLHFWQLPNRGNSAVCGWRIRAMSADLAGLLAGFLWGQGVCVRNMIGSKTENNFTMMRTPRGQL